MTAVRVFSVADRRTSRATVCGAASPVRDRRTSQFLFSNWKHFGLGLVVAATHLDDGFTGDNDASTARVSDPADPIMDA